MALTQITTDGIKDGTITGTDLTTNVDFVDNQKLRLGTGNDLQIYHDGTNSYIDNKTNRLYIRNNTAGNTGHAIILQAISGQSSINLMPYGRVELMFNGNKKFETTSTGATVTGQIVADGLNVSGSAFFHGNVDLHDNDILRIGTGDDLQIYHDGTNSIIKNDTNTLVVRTDLFKVTNNADNENLIVGNANGAVELYYDNIKRFETTSSGISVAGNGVFTGNVQINDGNFLNVGNSGDLQIFHNGSNSYIQDNGTGALLIGSNGGGVFIRGQHGEESIIANSNGSVELYHDNVKKMETSSVGVTMNDTLITNGEIRPANDNNHSIGRSNRRYITYFGVNGSINTSDKNEKNTIIDSDLGLDFINKLKPRSYKWNKDDGKTHYGLIAQDLEETLTSLGKTIADFGGIYKEDDSPMGLGYSELIAPLIKAIQELSTEVAALKAS